MAGSKHRPRQGKTLSKAGLDAVVKAYQRDLKRIRNSDENLGIYQHVNSTLVVAGPKDDVATFERLSESRRLRRVGLQPAGLRLPAPSYWRTRSPFALRSLLTYLESPRRKRFRRRLPSLPSAELLSRLETLEGRVRLEYRMSIAGLQDILERLLSEIARSHEALAFVLVVIDKTLTSSRASLFTASGVERFRLSRARCKALIRREYRFWGRDNPDEAAAAILSECAAHWDVFLANPPELTNQE